MASLVWDLWFGIFGLGSLVWNLRFRIFGLGSSVWDLWFGIFGLDSLVWYPEAGGILAVGEPWGAAPPTAPLRSSVRTL